MLLKRRDKQPLGHKLLAFFWPRRGPVRAIKYIWHRLARMPDTSHRLAAGFASGAAVSFTPLIGLHFGLGFLLALLTRGNLLASAIGTAVGNPWTFPFIFTLAGQTGELILGKAADTDVSPVSVSLLLDSPLEYFASLWHTLYPLIIGGIPNALIVWCVFYFGLRGLLEGYKNRRYLGRAEAKRADVGTALPKAE